MQQLTLAESVSVFKLAPPAPAWLVHQAQRV
jgi:hypothetical protein